MTCKTPSVAEAVGNGIADGAVDGIDNLFNGFGNKPYLWFGKIGNLSYVSDIANAAATGDSKLAIQKSVSFAGGLYGGSAGTAGGVALAASLGGSAAAAFLLPLAGGVLAGVAVSYAIDYYFSQKECEDKDKDPAEDFLPPPDGGGNNDYRIEYYDPLVIDINNDGVINTVAENGYQGALFDHDNDGFRTATGWVAPGDGLLVRDKNNDGIINNGGELFGDNTLLANGEFAKNGIEALADLDSNGDGILDSNDQAFNEIKVWQDLNSDGISTSDELFSLLDVDITSINLSSLTNVNSEVEGGIVKNQINFTKNDGSSSIIADVNFTNNPLYARNDNIIVSNEVATLPNVIGAGRLATLHQAASSSSELELVLRQYQNATTRAEQKNLLDKLMLEWAKTDPQYNDNDIGIMRHENLDWVESSSSTNVIRLTPNSPLPSYITQPPPAPEVANQQLKNIVKFINATLGIAPTTMLYEIHDSQIDKYTEAYNAIKENLYKQLLNKTILKPYLDAIDVYTDAEYLLYDFTNLAQLINQKYQTSPIQALEDLKDLFLINGRILEFGGWEKGLLLLSEWRDTLGSSPLYQAKVDKIFNEFDSVLLKSTSENDLVFIQNSVNNLFEALGGDDTLIIKNSSGLIVNGGDGDDVIVSGVGSDYLIGGTGKNSYIFYQGAGNDFIAYNTLGFDFDKLVFLNINSTDVEFYKQNQNLIIKYGVNDTVTLIGALDASSTKEVIFKFHDVLHTLNSLRDVPLPNLNTTDNDLYLNGWNGVDILTANSNDNQIYAFDGNDTITGDTGNDRLHGGIGQDTYIFRSGDGVDEIYESDFSIEANTVSFQNVNSADVQSVVFEGNDLVIKYGATDKLVLKNYINNSQNSSLNLQFADQVSWQNTDLMARVTFEGGDGGDVIEGVLNHRTNIINSNDGDDIVVGNLIAVNIIDGGKGNNQLTGGNNTDTLQGGSGDDFIYGLGGNDLILGGDGNNTLFGGDGDDVITGGDGNDWLQGDAGADILTGGMGDDAYDVDELDTIIENLNEGRDIIFIENNFDLSGTNIESIRLKGDGNFFAVGDENENDLYGNSGNNYLDGKGGGDLLSGGAGDDYYVVSQYDQLITNPDGTTSLLLGDQVVEGLLNSAGYVFGDSGGTDTIEQWDDKKFYSQDSNGNWFDTGKYHNLQSNVENVILKGDAKLAFGNELDNIITGNEQDNFINGLAGNDTYIYKKGGGTDTFSFEDELSAVNILKIEGHEASSLYAQKFGESVLIGFRNSTDKIWLSNYNLADYQDSENITFSNKFDQIVFDSGEVWTTSEIDSLLFRAENNQAPVIQQYPSTLNVKIEEVLQYTFNNVIADPDADDQLSFTLTLQTQGQDGEYQDIPEWIVFDSQTLAITVSPPEGADVGQLNFYLWGTDLYGVGTGVGVNINIQPSANTPIPGAIYDTLGNDALVGGIEDNIFFYTAGKDTIQDAGGVDILRFSNGITFNQVGSGLMKTGNDLVLKVNGSTTNQVTLKNYFLAGDHLIETIDFETGEQLTAEQIFNAFGVTLPETEQETGSTDVIGDTTYQYTTGELTITEQSGTDKVIFKNGLTFSQVANYLTKFGDDLILKVDGSNTNKVTVKNFFLAGQYLVESFQFETGGQLSAAQIFGAFGITMPMTEPENPTEPESVSVVGNTTYDYTTGSLTITEQSGNDTVVFKNGIGFSQVANYLTMSGDDLILKVDGSDTNKVTVKNFFLAGEYLVEIFQFETGGQITAEQIFGAFGLTVPEQNNPETSQPETGLEAMNSTYTYTSGTLQIDEDYGVDEIVFSNGISFNQVASQLMMSGDDLVLKIDGSNTDKVTIKNFFLGGAYEVESLSFETGGSISSSQIYQAFGLDRPLNAEDEISAVVLGDTGDNMLVSDAAVSELFILDQGQDMIQLLQNASGEAAKDYVSDFSLVDDKIDLSAVFVNSQVNNSNLDDYLQVFYDADAKTNTLSVRTSVNNMHKDMLVFTNQAEQLYVDDLLLNQSILY
ncbi:calcium-binding protein [Acinetobacter rongchengensis]|uniref:Type I secretion C-terminal target domain-containing protein n=1 Tax=Acinetobacter rongchengensis TaxID=2419601 RepID=A0A3A8F9B0_9GAMM|nr:calcium-binding protein [Acinetobacter rongchengensis]RKG37263.1 type I secretion C-terminal target domain-containing protein [Acinetobacter rongchengensis]